MRPSVQAVCRLAANVARTRLAGSTVNVSERLERFLELSANTVDWRHAGESRHPDIRRLFQPAGYRLSPVCRQLDVGTRLPHAGCKARLSRQVVTAFREVPGDYGEICV
jgi:hypothetical protein